MYSILRNIIKEAIMESLCEIYKRPNNGILELGVNAADKKRKYANTLWSIIQRNYAYMGGCKTFDSINGDDGFTDFLNGNYIWRIYFGDSPQDIKAAIIYKPTQYGRKRVCSVGTDKNAYLKTMDDDFTKSNHVYGEVSGKSEHLLQKDKRTNWIPKENVPDLLFGKKINLQQDKNADNNEKIPYDSNRHYYRKLGGETHRKAMFGNPIRKKN